MRGGGIGIVGRMGFFAPLIAAAVTAPAAPQAMVLGMFHFANPGLDAVKVKQRDILGQDRQAEVADLNARLAKYRPTKIFVEATSERQAELDKRYQGYLAGTVELGPSETEQVGFRLAKQFGLKRVIGVDYKSDMDFDSVMKFAAENGNPQFPQRTMQLMQKIGEIMNGWDRDYTVGQILAIHNYPPFVQRNQQFYTQMLEVDKAPGYPGADLIANWYRRNLVIYENFRRQIGPGDRALVIYGSGHAYYLRQLVADSGTIELVEPGKFLPKPPVTSFPDL